MIYDITPVVSPRLGVWPGDTPASREVLCDMARGDNITLSTLRATVHLGAHADAPSHYDRDGATIEARDLDLYLGPCQVIPVTVGRAERIRPGMVPGPILAPRVLFRTSTFSDPESFNTDFAALSPELIDMLAGQGVRLVGLDTPSVDLFDSKDLPSHAACRRNDLAILEGVVLRDVPAGVYELIALPLKLEGFDASPVRAVLRG
ncbi:MAG: cyclase family protein [Gemmataceae bacterium]|nr:cyclase family protein [Gemmataceae bacterium]